MDVDLTGSPQLVALLVLLVVLVGYAMIVWPIGATPKEARHAG